MPLNFKWGNWQPSATYPLGLTSKHSWLPINSISPPTSRCCRSNMSLAAIKFPLSMWHIKMPTNIDCMTVHIFYVAGTNLAPKMVVLPLIYFLRTALNNALPHQHSHFPCKGYTVLKTKLIWLDNCRPLCNLIMNKPQTCRCPQQRPSGSHRASNILDPRHIGNRSRRISFQSIHIRRFVLNFKCVYVYLEQQLIGQYLW